MTAAGNNGASTPEDDDPFGYLYEDGNAAGAASPSGRGRGYGYPGPGTPQPGVPRTSYNHVRAVGERTYGGGHHAAHQQPPQQAYGQQQYGQPHPQYAAPETYPGGAPTRPAPPQPGGGRGRGPNTKALLIAAIAVVVAVVAGITAAVINNNGKNEADGDKQPVATNSASGAPSPPEEPKDEPKDEKPSASRPAGLPKEDAATLRLGGPATAENSVKGSKGTGGGYVKFNGVGGSASWSVDVAEAGPYTLHVTYSVPGKDSNPSLTVNSDPPRDIRMNNFAGAKEGDWETWTYTWSHTNLQKGKNDLKISCEEGDTCDVLLSQVWLEAGHRQG
ncbi:carbohydrate-binding protein [Streptomyces clavuligerus]|uniref:Uncharacterized protein n=1 Tax=Streptomyces clavuligerus TaxID=1901 RepID=B5GNX9_STRCL|nr:carbohydrate-binding protein [Streptomyces clavuligerus]ANW18956.1 carbohydrate-binding protein [Streptomyces clavuligerus]AXU13534.1 carbohydrate-binding protein [Streptomyces clavuligerus]EDY48025.1 hypothetical protein SSCG_01053 [Streptomyces clavuligerus]EFG08332.1 Hypothetical protein SCLAV_3261 [Streptomyces clavuligerus]MBY6303495.1 carbohydrate-binding protein [Streptomyces clavuligerus]